MKQTKKENTPWRPSPRGVVLAVLGVVTLAVAILSVAVSYDILHPRFGAWAVPTVGALDALWVVFQATEILAGNNRHRVRRVQCAGLALTVINAAIPTADLLWGPGAFDLAVVLTPLAIVATKTAWWIALPSLGRKVSGDTQQAIDTKRQTVADRLEEMEAEAAHRIELLELATKLEKRVADAETAYRAGFLERQQAMTEALHDQAQATAATVAEMPLPSSVAAIDLPVLGQWTPQAPALPGTVDSASGLDRHATGTPVSALPGASGGTAPGTPAHPAAQHDVLAELAAVEGVPVPRPGEQLTGGQMDVVLRHMRYAGDPPMSYRQARDAFRRAGYVGSEERVRHAWGALLATEDGTATSGEPPAGDEPADADSGA
ncbi:hypothetical protein [Streptomyces uncialis]|uniref:hypothetical protein n=1 Tax=Streptomyces uncialis TaxID=1048205 RepID=UPI00224E1047|nr:hypothetical protein [Streptomyces uncialis]MCX4665043.1 hypothetical protein [Streptomyces uncialis]